MPKIRLDLGLKISIIIAVSVFVLMAFAGISGSLSLHSLITSTTGESYSKIAGAIAASIAGTVNRETAIVKADASNDLLKNDTAAKLKSIMASEKDAVEIAVTDPSGSITVSTRKTSSSNASGEDWWQRAFNGGKGKAAVGSILQDSSTGAWCIPFAAPIRDDGGNVTGIYRALIDIRTFFKPLEDFKMGRTGNALLVDDKGYLVYYPKSEPFANKFCDYRELQKALDDRSRWFISRTVYMHTPEAFASYAEVTNPALAEGGIVWRVFVVQNTPEVYGSLGAFTGRIALFAVLLVIAMTFAAIFIFAGIFKKPLRALEEGFERLSRGDLDYEVKVKTGDEIEHLAEAYNRMREALKKVTAPVAAVEKESQARQKAEYMANAVTTDLAAQSARLREEIAAVRNEMRLIAEQATGRAGEKQRHATEALETYISKMADTVNEMTEVAAVERGKVEIKIGPVDFKGMIKEAIFSLEPRIREKGLDLKLNVPGTKIMINADEAKLKRVFNNIVENAIKFTERGYIEISIKELKDTVECSVTDTGESIPAEIVPKAFEIAEPAGTVPGRKIRGGGPALFVAKGIVDAHKGRISIESPLGKMTKFTFSLPKA